MAVDPMKYRPILMSEWLAPKDIDDDGDLDLTLCRASATGMALGAMTLGEWTRTSKGSNWGRARIKTLLNRMRYATGEPNRPGYNQSHVPDFVRGAGFPASIIQIYNKPWPDIKESLKSGFVVTLAGDVAGTPAGSPMRRYVNPGVGHEILLTRLSNDGKQIAFIDPMTPHGTAVYERWAPTSHVNGFSSRFKSDNNVIAERWRRGKLTEAKDVARDRADLILKLQEDLAGLQRHWQRQQAELIEQDTRIDELLAQLEEYSSESVADLEARVDELLGTLRQILVLSTDP